MEEIITDGDININSKIKNRKKDRLSKNKNNVLKEEKL